MRNVSPSARRRADLGALVRRALGWPARVLEVRRTRAQLAQMSERELSDIGLLRADLDDGAAPPFDDDLADRLARARATRAWYGHARRDLAA